MSPGLQPHTAQSSSEGLTSLRSRFVQDQGLEEPGEPTAGGLDFLGAHSPSATSQTHTDLLQMDRLKQ